MINHVMIIPDGNRRYAKTNNLELNKVYKFISDNTTTQLIEFFLLGEKSKELTIFGLSRDNTLKRNEKDLEPIFDAQTTLYNTWLNDNKINSKIKFVFLGEKNFLPKKYLESIKELEQKTINNKLLCNILVAYDGQWDILNATKKIIKQKKIASIKNIFNELELKTPIDLIIRTGFEKRTSSAPLYQTTYTELIFTNYYYPELDENKLEELVTEYNKRDRRHGK